MKIVSNSAMMLNSAVVSMITLRLVAACKIASLSLLAVLLFGGAATASATDYSGVFSRVDPAVVVIQTKASRSVETTKGTAVDTDAGIGTGVLISKDGKVLTASHVVNSADEIVVYLKDGSKYDARVISSVVTADVALIELQDVKSSLPHVKVSDSDALDIGEEIFIVGTPYGLDHTLSVGHLSGRRNIGGDKAMLDVEFLQTDAAVNKGNSGGPMFSARGKLVGIVSHIRSQSGGSEGLGFAVATNSIKEFLLDQPPIWFGMEYLPMRGKLASALNVGVNHGFLIQRVAAGSLAEAFGLEESTIPARIGEYELLMGGDIVLKLGPDNLYLTAAGRKRVFDYVNGVPSGGQLEMTVLRNGREEVLTAIKP
jgi:serine protease Do